MLQSNMLTEISNKLAAQSQVPMFLGDKDPSNSCKMIKI